MFIYCLYIKISFARIVILTLFALFAVGLVYLITKQRRLERFFRFPYYLPDYIILIRHGESQGNVDVSAYDKIGDPKVELTEKGQQDAVRAGHELRQIVGQRPLFVYTSPYKRTLMTRDGVLSSFSSNQIVSNSVEVQLREREFHNTFQHHAVDGKEENSYGRVFFRYEGGESIADVYDRCTMFISSLWRDFKRSNMTGAAVVIVGHGLTNRVFLMRWLKWDPDMFALTANPANGTLFVLEKQPNNSYKLTDKSVKSLGPKFPPEFASNPRRYYEPAISSLASFTNTKVAPYPGTTGNTAALERQTTHSKTVINNIRAKYGQNIS